MADPETDFYLPRCPVKREAYPVKQFVFLIILGSYSKKIFHRLYIGFSVVVAYPRG